MPAEIASKQMIAFRRTAQRCNGEKARELDLRRDRALRVAREAANALKQQFGARCVVMFGSILSRDHFHQHSDIDLAVWGLGEQHHYRAVGILLSLDPEFSMDLIRAESAMR
jgi:predicted nucleotidyltransferase